MRGELEKLKKRRPRGEKLKETGTVSRGKKMQGKKPGVEDSE